MARSVEWRDGKVILIDQTRLPAEEVYLELTQPSQVAEAITHMRIRGAPAIGIAAAMGVALAADPEADIAAARAAGEAACEELAATRPTAVNLFWAIQRMRAVVSAGHGDARALREALVGEAQAISREQEEADRAIGRYGAALLPEHCRIITHCNAGGLATVEYGTALGVIRAAHEAGKIENVFVDETRPLLQGARLTAWELQQSGIPLTLICDNMAGYLMSRGEIDAAVVGADRIAANGDTANKIGTYPLAVLAARHGVAFYVAAPLSTFDLDLEGGAGIPIEERDASEICGCACGGREMAPAGIQVRNPAFDVTPAELITAIITEAGVLEPPFTQALRRMIECKQEDA